MSKSSSRKASSQSSTSPVGGLDTIFGPPPFLEGEDPAGYQSLFAQVTAAVAPNDVIEEIWTRDFVDVTWEIMRLRRLRLPVIEAGYGKVVQDIYQAETDYMSAINFRDRWLRNDDEARAEFIELLGEHGLTMDDVRARAMAEKIDIIERFDRLIEKAEHRRGMLYAEIERRRELLARRLREAAKTIEAQLRQEDVAVLGPVEGQA